MSIPVVATERQPLGHSNGSSLQRMLITGASGVIGTILANRLQSTYHITGLDIRPPAEETPFTSFIQASLGDRDLVMGLASEAEVILHLATGATAGWDGLLSAEINGTRNLLDGALGAKCRRFIYASSNHVSGWAEIDFLTGKGDINPVHPADMPRPDGLYAAAKVFAESLLRCAAEWSGLGVSILRIGTVRCEDIPSLYYNAKDFEYIGDKTAVQNRLARTWLRHSDLLRLVQEEIAAKETFRLRFASSNQENQMWSTQTYQWNRL